jgi:hypothetical protein
MVEGAYFCAALTSVSLTVGNASVKGALITPLWSMKNADASPQWFTPCSTKQKTERLFSPFSLSKGFQLSIVDVAAGTLY